MTERKSVEDRYLPANETGNAVKEFPNQIRIAQLRKQRLWPVGSFGNRREGESGEIVEFAECDKAAKQFLYCRKRHVQRIDHQYFPVYPRRQSDFTELEKRLQRSDEKFSGRSAGGVKRLVEIVPPALVGDAFGKTIDVANPNGQFPRPGSGEEVVPFIGSQIVFFRASPTAACSRSSSR